MQKHRFPKSQVCRGGTKTDGSNRFSELGLSPFWHGIVGIAWITSKELPWENLSFGIWSYGCSFFNAFKQKQGKWIGCLTEFVTWSQYIGHFLRHNLYNKKHHRIMILVYYAHIGWLQKTLWIIQRWSAPLERGEYVKGHDPERCPRAKGPTTRSSCHGMAWPKVTWKGGEIWNRNS